MGIREEFASQPQEVKANFEGMYGASAPFFWAAQSGRIQVPPEAQEFYNLDPKDQATWYGVHGENAATAWLAEKTGKTPTPGPAAPGTAGGNVSPVAANVLKQPQVGTGLYPKSAGGQTVSPFNKLTKGAGVEGMQYGYGGDWNRPGEAVKINPKDLPHLFDPKLAPGYIPGSGTYNQYRLDTQDEKPRFPGGPTGLFWTLPNGPGGKDEVVNSRYGLGGTGDPTNGSEIQTARRWITGNPADSDQPTMGDEQWRREHGGGGVRSAQGPSRYVFNSNAAGAGAGARGGGLQPPPQGTPGVAGMQQPMAAGAPPAPAGAATPPPAQPMQEPQPLALPYYQTNYATGGGAEGGVGGGFFANGPGVYGNWGQTQDTVGLDYIATVFMRADTPTGVGTTAAGAPASMWQGLINEIRKGRVVVKDPQAWAMLAQKVPGTTPQSIGGAATSANNVQPSGQAGAGGTGTGTGGDPTGGTGVSGTWKEGEQTELGPIKGGLVNGFDLAYNQLLQKVRQDARANAIEEAKLSGVFNGLPTVEAQKLAAEIADNAEKNAINRINADANMKAALTDEAYKLALTQNNKDRLALDTGIATGYIGDKATVDQQRLLAEQQQAAYARAANPAMSFENEYARGATGWNTGDTAGMAGVPGMTKPGQTVEQFGLAGGWGNPAQSGIPNPAQPNPTPAPSPASPPAMPTPPPGSPVQPGPAAPAQAPGTTPDMSFIGGGPYQDANGQWVRFNESTGQVEPWTGQMPSPGARGATQPAGQVDPALVEMRNQMAAAGKATEELLNANPAYQQLVQQINSTQDPTERQTLIQQAQSMQKMAEQQTGMEALRQRQAQLQQQAQAATPGADWATVQGQPSGQDPAAMAMQQASQQYEQMAAQQKQQAQAMQPNAQQQTGASNNLFAQQSANAPSAQPTAQRPGQTDPGSAQAVGAQGTGGVPIRTPAAIMAFKRGSGMASSGNYGSSTGSVQDSTSAPINTTQVRLQNLKQTRKLSPVARAVVGSFAKAGGTDEATQKMYAERGAPGTKSTTGGYSLK